MRTHNHKDTLDSTTNISTRSISSLPCEFLFLSLFFSVLQKLQVLLLLTSLSTLHSASYCSPIKLYPSIKQIPNGFNSHMADAKDSSIANSKIKSSPTSITISTSQQQHTMTTFHFLMAQNILRILATLLSAASIIVMVTNNQTVFIFSIRFQAHFYYSPSFKFFVAANGVVTGLSLLALIVNLLLKHQASPIYHFFLLVHDIVMTVLLIAGCAAATAIGYVGQFGEKHVGWQPICEQVHKFCKTNLVSLLLSYLAFIAYFVLTILSAYKCLSSSLKHK